jgi:hypothetical protein
MDECGSAGIFVREDTPPSVDDSYRKELLWEHREERLVVEWALDCKSKSKAHDIQSKRYKKLYAVFGVPSIFIPIILGGVSSFVACNSLAYSLGMMTTGLFAGIGIFFNFSKKQAEHCEYENKFLELALDVDMEMAKPKRHRVACDVFMERIKLRYTGLIDQQPNL